MIELVICLLIVSTEHVITSLQHMCAVYHACMVDAPCVCVFYEDVPLQTKIFLLRKYYKHTLKSEVVLIQSGGGGRS